MRDKFLPMTLEEAHERGWNELDVIVVTGDAYVDHPSYGASVIGRILESRGYRVGIIAQPDWRNPKDFIKLGRPKLFFGVTAGNLDSMLANYTSNRNHRREDEYSPGAKAGLRPDRATIIYANRIKESFSGVPVVMGGIEASVRRLAHYDYWSDKVRRSMLFDSKADILVYGMGEKQTLSIAGRLKDGEPIKNLTDIKGTVVASGNPDSFKDHVMIPSFEEVSGDSDKFNRAFKTIYLEADPKRGHTIVQKHGNRFAVQLAPAEPLTREEIDGIYALPYLRRAHPKYDKDGGIPGLETVRFSIISHRGCCGACSFCSLYLHQGRIVQSRSPGSILEEAKRLAADPDFKGTITDIGGPTANMYMAECKEWKESGTCRARQCVMPGKCKNLMLGYGDTLKLWERVSKIPKVRHLFIGSGVRYDLLTDKDSQAYLKALCGDHVSGRLKVAPEHTEEKVLWLMNKPSFATYEEFAKKFDIAGRSVGKKQFLVNYLISAHPGCTLEDSLNLSLTMMKKHIHPEQIQDFIPLPMTMSAAMYHTGKDPMTGSAIYVARGLRERKLQRALVQYGNPENRRYVIEALRKLGRMDLAKDFLPKSYPQRSRRLNVGYNRKRSHAKQ